MKFMLLGLLAVSVSSYARIPEGRATITNTRELIDIVNSEHEELEDPRCIRSNMEKFGAGILAVGSKLSAIRLTTYIKRNELQADLVFQNIVTNEHVMTVATTCNLK